MTIFFVDTNILWWYFVKNSQYHQSVKMFLDPLILDPENLFVVNEFVMIELFHLLIKKKGREGFDIVSMLLNENYPFLQIEYDLLQITDLDKVSKILFKYGNSTTIGGRDSTILYSMSSHKITNIITNDKGFEKIGFIKVHNPLD